ncbi:MAG: hypothetical protein ABI554_02325 [Flavobacterium sp.]
MATTQRLAWETLRSIDSATFTGSKQAIGTPIRFPSYICKLVNNSNVLVTISVDGINDVDVAPANSFFLYDEGKSGLNSFMPALPAGTQFYVTGSAGVGLVYLVTQYVIQG